MQSEHFLNYTMLTVIILLLVTTLFVLAAISQDNNTMLHSITKTIQGTGNRSNQEHIEHQLDEILANTTASNGVLIPKAH